MRALVAGWFSFDGAVGTVGDELGVEVVVGWLRELDVEVTVAWAPQLQRGPHWRDLDPAGFTHLVFVGGPVSDTPVLRELTEAFAGARRWAVNASVVSPEGRALFDQVWEPDVVRPDLALATRTPDVPVLAVAFGAEHDDDAVRLRGVLEEWLATRSIPWFELDVALFRAPHERFPVQVEALVRRADAVLGMSLEALVLGLAHGRPVIALDPVRGGGSVGAQARALGWPLLLRAGQVDPHTLDAALEHALSGTLDDEIAEAQRRGAVSNAEAREWLRAQLRG